MLTLNKEYYSTNDFYNICVEILHHLNVNEIQRSRMDGNAIFKINVEDTMKMNFIQLFFILEYISGAYIPGDYTRWLKITNFSNNNFKKYISIIRKYKLYNVENIYNK
jgi:hypothetical protein